MKRKETLALEAALDKDTREKRIYGCEEITIGFYNNGHGNEIVDFMTMDSKGIIKCYEIKVTLQDLKSDAKKSWYGHYNYLVTTKELYEKIENWDEYIPKGVGIIVGRIGINSTYLESKRKAKKNDISLEDTNMLKESMVRSIYWKMIKYKDRQDPEKQKKIKSTMSKLKKDRDYYYERAMQAEQVISDYENYKFSNEGIDIDLAAEAKREKEKYLNNRKAARRMS